MKHPLKIGSILYASWGYDQTNVDFYKVTELKGSTMVRIVPIGSKTVGEAHSRSDIMVVPNLDKIAEGGLGIPHGSELAGKWKRPRGDGSMRLTNYANAYPYDGTPKRETNTAAGFGH